MMREIEKERKRTGKKFQTRKQISAFYTIINIIIIVFSIEPFVFERVRANSRFIHATIQHNAHANNNDNKNDGNIEIVRAYMAQKNTDLEGILRMCNHDQ